MRVLQVVGDSKFGGATYLILAWSKFLLEKNCDVTVLSTDDATVTRLREIRGMNVINSIYIPRDLHLGKVVNSFIQLFGLLKRKPFDIVHTHTSTPGFVGRLTSWLASAPVRLHTAHGWPITEFSSLTARLVFMPAEYLASLVSTNVICVSHATAHLGKKLHISPHDKLVTICNGIDPRPFVAATENELGDRVRKMLHIPKGTLLIGNVGRLASQKGNETLIRAMIHLREFLPEQLFTLLLAGDGPERKKLEDLTQSLRLSNSIRFLGYYKEVPDLLASLDIFVSPSLWEGLSISLLEAMASARPIITTTIPPNAELIEHEVTGLLVPLKSPRQVAEAIVRFVREPELAQRCAIAARQRALEHYTIDRMFQETWDLYNKLLEQKRLEKVDS